MASIIIYNPDAIIENAVSTYLPTADTVDYENKPYTLINPDLSSVDGAPQKYWKVDSDLVVEMTTQEKDVYDSNLVTIATGWQFNYVDYKKARVALYISMVTKGGFDNLSTSEKEVACQWFIVNVTQRSTIYTIAEQITFGQVFNKNSVEARRKRISKSISEVYNRLTIEQANQIVLDVTGTNQLYNNYVDFGIEGTQEGNSIGLFDYMTSQAGTPYENAGFKNYDYIPVGYANMTTLSDAVMDILKNGNY